MKKNLIILAALISMAGCSSEKESEAISKEDKKEIASLPLDNLKLPEGYEIQIYANVPNARSMAISEKGTVYVGNRKGTSIYAIPDGNKDFVADRVIEIRSDLVTPNGVAYKDGDLYVAEVNRILKFGDIENAYSSTPEFSVINDKYPTETHHGWKYIAFGPDGFLYVPVGAPCNICKSENEIFASITKLDVNTGELIPHVRGVRNSVGFDWDPNSNQMWFTDNGRDMLGEDLPPCELNVVTEVNAHYGYPYCHAGEFVDPEFGKEEDCDKYTKPAQQLGAHVAPLGMKFVKGSMFAEFENQILIAEHGSWNRKEKAGL